MAKLLACALAAVALLGGQTVVTYRSTADQSEQPYALYIPKSYDPARRYPVGDKTKQGFYKKEKDAEGKEVRLVLDWKTLEYVPAIRPKIPSLEMAKNAEKLPERLAQLLAGDARKDKAARFHWRLLSALWNYSADCLPEIADDASSVDRA